jgi:CheY-like chemotaxis protein
MRKQQRILLVDDEERILFVVGESLKKLEGNCEINTARNGVEALTLMEQNPFDLIITDLKMPQMDGVQLTEKLRARYPSLPIIWMTAYGADSIRERAEQLGVQHFLNKPLDIEDIRQIARSALDAVMNPEEKPAGPGANAAKQLRRRLSQLQAETEAYVTMVITMSGYPVNVVGLTDGLDVSTLSALVAGNFLAAHEIATMLGEESSFKLSYYESDQHNIYAYGICEEYLLLTVFGDETKPGVVWFYAQRAVEDLADILQHLDLEDDRDDMLNNVSDEELQSALDSALDSALLFAEAEGAPENNGNGKAAAPSKDAIKMEEDEYAADEEFSLLSFSEAIAQGVIPGDMGFLK